MKKLLSSLVAALLFASSWVGFYPAQVQAADSLAQVVENSMTRDSSYQLWANFSVGGEQPVNMLSPVRMMLDLYAQGDKKAVDLRENVHMNLSMELFTDEDEMLGGENLKVVLYMVTDSLSKNLGEIVYLTMRDLNMKINQEMEFVEALVEELSKFLINKSIKVDQNRLGELLGTVDSLNNEELQREMLAILLEGGLFLIDAEEDAGRVRYNITLNDSVKLATVERFRDLMVTIYDSSQLTKEIADEIESIPLKEIKDMVDPVLAMLSDSEALHVTVISDNNLVSDVNLDFYYNLMGVPLQVNYDMEIKYHNVPAIVFPADSHDVIDISRIVGTFSDFVEEHGDFFFDLPFEAEDFMLEDSFFDEGFDEADFDDFFEEPDSPDFPEELPMPTPEEEVMEPEVDLPEDGLVYDYNDLLGDDAILGDDNAPLTLVEFGDYECPFCKRHATQTMPQIISDYIDTGKLKFVFRDFPLGFHANALPAAKAAECARVEGGDEMYFRMHDMIFGGDELSEEVFRGYANILGLDSRNFLSCTASDYIEDEIMDDMASGSDFGITGTPGFILTDGEEFVKISGAYPFEKFQEEIEALLAR